MFRFTTLTIFTLVATFVAAQDTTDTPDPSGTTDTPNPSGTSDPCILNCSLLAAITAGCLSSTDLTCICNTPVFQTDVGTCVQQRCPDQLAAATALWQETCAGVSISSGAPSGTPSASASGTPGTSTPITSAPGTSRPSTTAPPSSGTGNTTSSTTSSTRSGAALKNAPVAGAMGALAALVGAAIF